LHDAFYRAPGVRSIRLSFAIGNRTLAIIFTPMSRPVVASYCTQFLKPEMLHIYRQVTELRRWSTYVIAKERMSEALFPFKEIEMVKKRSDPARYLFLKFAKRTPSLVYRGELDAMHEILERRPADVMHIYFGHTAVHLLPFIESWDKSCIVSFHGADVMLPDIPDYEIKMREMLGVVPLVLARSESLRDRLVELGCAPEKIRINRTGIPLDQFPLGERAAPADGAWIFVQACRLIPKKGLPTALQAFHKFAQKFPKAKFIIAGEGPMKNEIEKTIADYGLRNNVEMRGFLSQEELFELYLHGHVFLHPSEMTADKNQEGVPNSMLEAMSTGLPVVATLHGGIPEAVRDGETGFLVAEKDDAALFAAMCRVTESADHWMKMGRAASASVGVQFEQSAQIAALENCYDEAVELSRAKA
jgi:colanic acid/amylovoran biosynthesis glycosyltransferase